MHNEITNVFGVIRGLHLRMPADARQRKAHGFAADVCSLVVEPSTGAAADGLLDSIFEPLQSRAHECFIIPINPMKEPTFPFLKRRDKDIMGLVAYEIGDASVKDVLRACDAERCAAIFVDDHADETPPSHRLVLPSYSEIGALLRIAGDRGAVVTFESTHDSFELLGKPSAIVQVLRHVLAGF
jgi:hypothetical protein